MQRFKLVSILLGSLISLNGFAQVKINVQKGQKYQVVNNLKTTSTAEVMGSTSESITSSNITTLYEVKDVESAEIKLESTITKIKAESSMMGQNTSFDSEKKDNDGPLAEPLTAMLNKPSTIKLDNKGMVTKADANEAADAAMAALGAGGNGAKVDLFIPVLVGKELKVGDSYPETDSTRGEKMNTTNTGTYKIISIDNGIASITYNGTQVVSGEMEQMGMAMNISSNGKVVTEIKLDTRNGLVLSKSMVNDATMTIDVMGMTIPSTVKTTMSVTISPAQ